jgi:hypothetical protein
MTSEQILAVKCAHADLIGALQNFNSNTYSDHNWKAHKLSIIDLENAFEFLDSTSEETLKSKT